MKVGAFVVCCVACGGVLDEPGDGAVDASQTSEASKDVTQAFDVAAPDVSIDDGVPGPPICPIATANLVAYFPLDVDTLDHSGHGNDATATNLTSTQGVVNGAKHFDGATSKLHVSAGAATLSGARTLCAWMKSDATQGAGQPVFWGGASGSGDFYAVFSNAPSNTTCSKTVPNALYVDHWSTDCIEASLPPVMPMKWTFACWAYDGGAIKMSVDGNENKAPGSLYDYPLTTLFIGSTLGSGTTTNGSFAGDLDEVSVWSKALQQSEVQSLWNGGAGCVLP